MIGPFKPAIRCATAIGALMAFLSAGPFNNAFAQDNKPVLSFGIGWSALNIDDIEFAAITDFFATEVLEHQSNEDGSLNGYKLTAELAKLSHHRHRNWLLTSGLKGFYSRYEDEEQTRCLFTSNTDCKFIPLVDPDPSGTIGVAGGADASGGLFSDWLTDVERQVVYWGAAIELSFSREATLSQSLKDGPVLAAPAPFQWHLGLSFRQLNQDVFLFSEDRGPTLDPVTLDDDLDTNYYGAYAGFSSWKELGAGYRLRLSGETGLYYAQTDYYGAYTASNSLGDDQPVAASIALSDVSPAFIGSLQLLLEKNLGGQATLGLFTEAEWLSYVPKVLYNDTDLNGGGIFDIVGDQNGTALGDGAAFAYTIGARIRIGTY